MTRAVLLGLCALLVGAPAAANEALADQHGCTSCHAPDKKSIGPSFKALADKYAGQADVVATLAAKVRAGSTGVWGKTAMPAMAHVSEADARTVVAWMLKP
jgi:cytochrome c